MRQVTEKQMSRSEDKKQVRGAAVAGAKKAVPRKSSAERQEQILRELAGLLGARGAARASTSELAKKVGVTEPALYRHFESKAKMLWALLDFCQAGLESIDKSGAAALAKAGEFMESNPSVARLMAGDGLSGEGRELNERMEGLWIEFCKRAYPAEAGLGQAGGDWLRGAMARWVVGDRSESAMGSESAKAALRAFGAQGGQG